MKKSIDITFTFNRRIDKHMTFLSRALAHTNRTVAHLVDIRIARKYPLNTLHLNMRVLKDSIMVGINFFAVQ